MGDESSPAPGSSPTVAQGQTTQDLLADIFGSNDEMPTSSPSAPVASQPAKSSVNDILGLFDSQASISSTSSPYTSPPLSSASAPNPMGDLFSAVSSTPGATSPPPAPLAPQENEVYNAHGLRISLTGVRDAANPLVANILAKFYATVPAQGVSFQAAVPKAQRLQMMAMSKTDVSPGSVETQQLRVMVQTPGVRLLVPLFILKLTWPSTPRALSGCVSASPSRRLGRLCRTKPTTPFRPACFESAGGTFSALCDRRGLSERETVSPTFGFEV